MIWTVMTILQWSVEFLKSKGSETPRLDAELMLCAVLRFKRVELYTKHDRPLDEAERQKYREYIRRRASGEPVAYILGEKSFHGRDFKVDHRVLIPRPETELLVDMVIEDIQSLFAAHPTRGVRVLDIGTGSGCIAISLAAWWLDVGLKKWPAGKLDVAAWDVSEEALILARENAARILPSVQIAFSRTDLFAESSYDSPDPWDVVVSNPPYIARQELDGLMASVRDHEPHLALIADDEGTACYRMMAKSARRMIVKGGKIFLEIGAGQASPVKNILEINGWGSVRVELDYARLPRNVIAVNPG